MFGNEGQNQRVREGRARRFSALRDRAVVPVVARIRGLPIVGSKVGVLVLHDAADPSLKSPVAGSVTHPPESGTPPGEPGAGAAQLGQELPLGHFPQGLGLGCVVG